MSPTESTVSAPHFLPTNHLRTYRGVAGHWDEAVRADGAVRPHWQTFAQALDPQSAVDVQRSQDLCRRILRESGVTYAPPGGSPRDERPWQLDCWPLLISAEEWQLLSTAVSQRARVLNRLLADIYGPRQLMRSGDLPPELVLANPEFMRPAHQLAPPQGIHLHLYAVDLARSPDGRWWVIGDRTDTPSGAGYALENRIVVSRVYPQLIQDCKVERLARFFQQLRDGLLARAAVTDREPRIVIFTPGPYHSTYFEQAYLARYLGFNLVEGRDLTVRDQGVFLKTLSGLLPVDVILRRVDSDYCDALELRGDSLLGVPGLLQAARTGTVVIANAVGSGVVETPALLPFLPSLCRKLLDEELLLPPIATWWCGQEEALKTVLAQLDRLVIQRAFGHPQTKTILPGEVPREQLAAQIKAAPHLYLGQEFVALSTAPTWQERGLTARHVVLRLYAAAIGADEYVVMPGGLTRASQLGESTLLDGTTAGGSKDTWVISDSLPDTTTLLPRAGRSSDLSRAGFVLPSRLADDLFWLGRYVERIEFGCRLVRCLLHRLTNQSEHGQIADLGCLIDTLVTKGALTAEAAAEGRMKDLIQTATFQLENAESIAGDVAKLHRIAAGVRDRLSLDAWRILTDLHDDFTDHRWTRAARPDAQLTVMDDAIAKLSAFIGQSADGMTRDKGWLFLDIGRRLERVADLAQLIRTSLTDSAPNEGTRLLALLEIANSAMTYQSRYIFGPDAARVLDLLLCDDTNPHSISFQLSTLFQHVRALRAGESLRNDTSEMAIVSAASADIRLLDVDAVAQANPKNRRTRLEVRLERTASSMNELSSALTRTYLNHVHASRPVEG